MPAMPQSATENGYGCNYGNEDGQVAQGLTKREMFAMHAMTGFAHRIDGYTFEDMAKDAVAFADALLSELDK